MWIATYGGGINKLLYENGKNKFKCFSRKNGLPNDFIYRILFDTKGLLWISTNGGLISYDTKTNNFRTFDFTDGLQSNEFTSGAFYDKKNDVMYFGGINGFNSFVPDLIQRDLVKPKILLTDFKIFNNEVKVGENSPLKQTINETKEIRLSYKDFLFSIEFASTYFVSPEKIKYAYMLKGLDNNWNYTGSNMRIASYNNLPGGKYIFRVKASDSDTDWRDKGICLTIIVEPPFYQTWLFRIAAFIVFIFLIVAWFRYRTKAIRNRNKMLEEKVQQRTQELEEVNKTKDKFFSIIAHDLKSPFQVLLGSSEILHDEYNSLSEDEKSEFVINIKNTIKNTYQLLENLLQWSRLQTNLIEYSPEIMNLYEELLPTINLHTGVAKNKNILINNLVDKNISVKADRNMLNVIVRNLISNAIKYTAPNGMVNLDAGIQGNTVTIYISDTGQGIPENILDKIFQIGTIFSTKGTRGEKGTGLGLLLCKEMVEKQGGNIFVKSTEGKGTTFSFTLPKN